MRFAVIGAGNVGGAIARAASAAGHDVVVAAPDRDQAQAVAESVGGQVVQSSPAAVQNADIVVLAVPFGAVEAVADEIAARSTGKIVIDVTNPLRSDLSGLTVTDRSAAEVIQERLPGASVVKAFNTVLAANQTEPVLDGVPLDGYVASDDPAARKVVADMLVEMGYRPVDVGALSSARALEHMALLNISLNATNNWSWRTGWKLLGPTG
jgi:8-hydroxy-5-deazaflavin:NADPH oxidoreductase